jgi:hypothetical protein
METPLRTVRRLPCALGTTSTVEFSLALQVSSAVSPFRHYWVVLILDSQHPRTHSSTTALLSSISTVKSRTVFLSHQFIRVMIMMIMKVEESATPIIKPTEAISMLSFWSEPSSFGLWPLVVPSPAASNPTAVASTAGNSCNCSKNSDASVKSVRFSTVQVREYPITIGDCLCVSDGVPHTIEWEYLEEHKMNVNQYERTRPTQQRRQGDSLILDSHTREQRLRSVGYTTQDFLDVVRAREMALRALYL